MTTPTALETASQQRTVGRTARAPTQLWQVPTFFAGLLAFVVVTAGSAFRPASAGREFDSDLAKLRQGLKEKVLPAALLELAEKTVKRADDFPNRAAEAHYLLGTVCARLAEELPADRAADERKRAYQHLDFAEAKGVSPDDLPRVQYQLGKLLYQSGAVELQRIIDYLGRATARGADDPAEGYAMLTQAYLSLRPPDVEAALVANQKLLEHSDDEAVLAPARLLRADLLLRKGERLEAIKVLKQVGPAAPQYVRLKARRLQAQCCQEEKLWGQAVPLWQELLVDPTVVPGGKAHILYSLGLCLARVEPPEEAKATSAWQEAAALGGQDGQAASLRLAELLLHGKEPARALDWFRHAVEKVPSVRDYQNALLGLDEVRALFETGCRVYRAGQDAERARDLAVVYRKLALPGVAEERIAEATEAQAAALLKKAQALDPGPQAATEEENARKLYRDAGAAYELAAEGRLPLEKAQRLRRSADCYAHAHEQTRAVAVLRRYVELDPPPVQKAEGWFALAEAHRRSSPPQREEALKAYQECLQYPNNPLAQRARLEVARLEIGQSNLADAEKILLQSLALAASTADRQAEEQALYELGKLLFQQGEHRYAEARIRLSEAVSRYPANPDAFWARDQLGTCYYQLGEQAKKATLVADLPGEKRRVYEHDMYTNFRQSLEVFQKLGDDLEKLAASRKLAAAEDTLLCRVRFMVPDCHSELRSYDEAVRGYQSLAQRYRGRMEGLMACESLMLCCYRCQGDPDQWRKVIQATRTAYQAAVSDLPRMPDEEFRRCRNTKLRNDWADQLTRGINWLAQIPAQPAPRSDR